MTDQGSQYYVSAMPAQLMWSANAQASRIDCRSVTTTTTTLHPINDDDGNVLSKMVCSFQLTDGLTATLLKYADKRKLLELSAELLVETYITSRKHDTHHCWFLFYDI